MGSLASYSGHNAAGLTAATTDRNCSNVIWRLRNPPWQNTHPKYSRISSGIIAGSRGVVETDGNGRVAAARNASMVRSEIRSPSPIMLLSRSGITLPRELPNIGLVLLIPPIASPVADID